jgi:hypothetical protein
MSAERARYVLADYTVELRPRGWYFGRPYEGAASFRGPYASAASVTLMIARQFQREIVRRHQAPREPRDAPVSPAD